MSENDPRAVPDQVETVRPARNHRRTPSGGGYFEIILAGHLDENWAECMGDLIITHDQEGNTLLSGEIPDQAALHGLLVQIRDLGLPLISLRRITF